MLASAKYTHLSVMILSAILIPSGIVCADDYFDPAFVTDPSGRPLSVDLSSFRESDYLPGNYHVDIFINDSYVDTKDINFTSAENNTRGLVPCLAETQLIQYGVKVDNYRRNNVTGQCYDLNDIPGTTYRFIPAENKLILAIPQIALDSHVLDKHLEQRWDDGIPAIFTDYNLSGRSKNNTKTDKNDDTFYLNLRSGINAGAWRYRNYGTWSRESDGTRHWETQLN